MLLSLPIARLFKNCAKSYITSVNKYTMDKSIMLESVKACIPALDGSSHKGQAGRIGIVGGSLEYTGAPYFAGISALKVGADLIHVFCATSAATVIKSYSPELIVHPLLNHPNAVSVISPWLDRLHAVVIGPGLGREADILQKTSELIGTIREKKIPLVIDADGLFLLNNNPRLIENFMSPVILTPNRIEFERLTARINIPEGLGNNVIVLKKGQSDEIFSNSADVQWKSDTGGSSRRCGGQGDLLSGSIATFLHWTLANVQKVESGLTDGTVKASSLSCYAASCLVRRCNEKAFKMHGRSMLASDMIGYIHEAFEELFGQ